MQWPYGQFGFDAVFSGHDHVYERIERDTNYFVVGTGGGTSLYQFVTLDLEGSNFRYNEDYGALFASVSDEIAALAFINVDGEVIDRFQMVKEVPESATWSPLLLGIVVLIQFARSSAWSRRGFSSCRRR